MVKSIALVWFGFIPFARTIYFANRGKPSQNPYAFFSLLLVACGQNAAQQLSRKSDPLFLDV